MRIGAPQDALGPRAPSELTRPATQASLDGPRPERLLDSDPVRPAGVDLPRPAQARPASVGGWIQAVSDLARSSASAAVRAVMIGALGASLVGCSTLEIDVHLDDGQTQRVEMRGPLAQIPPEATNNDARVDRFADELAALEAQTRILSDEIHIALSHGIRSPRSGATRGYEGVLGPKTAILAARAVLALSPEERAVLDDLLAKAGGAPFSDRVTEQALILKALGARLAGDTVVGLDEVGAFAAAIRGMPRSELITRTTLLDVQDQNTHATSPEHLGRPGGDRFGDNDGVYQRYTNTCVPTVGEMMRGELDPVYALEVHGTMTSTAPGDGGGREQARLITAAGGTLASRLGADVGWTRFDADDLAKSLDPVDSAALLAYVSGRPLDEHTEAQLSSIIVKLKARGIDAERSDLEAMRARHVSPTSGMSTLGGLWHFSPWPLAERPFAGEASLPTLRQLLEGGVDVPIRAGDSARGHALLVSDVRGPAGQEHYLISDPWEGRTAWVRRSALVDGSFLYTTFHLGYSAVTHFFPPR